MQPPDVHPLAIKTMSKQLWEVFYGPLFGGDLRLHGHTMAEPAGHTNKILRVTSPPRIHMGWESCPRQKGAFHRAGILADKISFFQESIKHKKKRSPVMVNDR